MQETVTPFLEQRILADRQTSSTPEEVRSGLALLSCPAERHDRNGIGDVDRLVALRARGCLGSAVEVGDQLLERSIHGGRKAEIGLQVATRQDHRLECQIRGCKVGVVVQDR